MLTLTTRPMSRDMECVTLAATRNTTTLMLTTVKSVLIRTVSQSNMNKKIPTVFPMTYYF